jgi:hypothetical protein
VTGLTAERARYLRVTIPGEDSSSTDLWVALAIRLALLVLFTASAATASTIGGRAFFVAGLLLWAALTVDTALTLRRRRTPPD